MNELLWYLSRATGVVSITLLTVVVLLGLVTSGRRRPHGERATVIMAVHRWLSLGMVVFLVGHIATAIAETYVTIDLVSAVLPFTSGYAPFWVGLGTLSADILAAITITSLLRHRISERVWRLVHYAAYLLWPMAFFHGLALGTSSEPLLRTVTVLCGVAGAGGIVWRLLSSHHDRDRREAVLTQEWT
jgi:sulfoxide reductase heme-binding subunit YedZ